LEKTGREKREGGLERKKMLQLIGREVEEEEEEDGIAMYWLDV
jgi:hypothetical protein